MTTPILVSLFVALAAGAATGFRRGWKASLLVASLAVPIAVSLILQEPPWLQLREALVKLLWSVLGAGFAWSVAAGLHHFASRMDSDSRSPFLRWGSSAIVALAVPTAAVALFSQWAVNGLGARDMGLALFFAFLAAVTGVTSLYAAPVLTLAGLVTLYFRRGTGLRFLAAGAACGIPVAVLALMGG